MDISRGLKTFGLYFVIPISLILVVLGLAFSVIAINLPDDFDETVDIKDAAEFDKTVPIGRSDLGSYSGEQIFESAYQAYVCSFLMTSADQIEKGQLLRWHSVALMQARQVAGLGKNWNDVNFSGVLDATKLINKYVEKHNVSKAIAAAKILTEDRQCIALNRFIGGVWNEIK
jgi:hypothetical protein